ncbi:MULTISPECIES: DUF3368 domain-containing protein [Thiorhodovibrio]|uniref:DUF3368 domain-containing protein n=1 Tax=Thiorhodovibrio TaxID=61593 RepID=UPI0019143A50|nr:MULTISPECIES: DUF3368 domain-containing protein [Thiorhodovibrio]MBK5971112.1 hypothetical protein [Thiorhodovibrio winogradskyi]WPL10520.1 hypothetical protein Thiosp_00235 [Thiorhodovibrio litoralis]
MTVVSDTSVLRYLVTLDAGAFLQKRFGRILMPPEVAEECLHPSAPGKLRTFIQGSPDWLDIKMAEPLDVPGLERLDHGESAAIRLALGRQADLLLIDERIGRKTALGAGLRVAGTLGLLADAAQRGWLDFDEAVSCLTAQTNFRVSPEVLRAVSRMVQGHQGCAWHPTSSSCH